MKKKILKNTCYVLGVILVSALIAGGAMYLFKKYTEKRNVVETGNVLGISWYNETDTEFTISTVDELYEFAKLSTHYNFKGQTIRLGADIVINEGNAADWEVTAPSKKWTAINGFAGTFDGQGHTISGLYAKGYNVPIALFKNAKRECHIQNFKITNSYFEGSGFGGVASVVSNGGGNFKQIYSDAIVNVVGLYSGYAGGICSKLNVTTNIEECWFDGVVATTGRDTGGIVDDVIGCSVTMKHCLFSGEIRCAWDYSGTRLGGLVGRAIKDGAIVTIEDSLSVGVVNAEVYAYTGSVLGTAMSGTVLNCTNVFGASGKYGVIGTSGEQGDMRSVPLKMQADNLVGYKAYQWTSLDFENYWSVVEDGTPILKCFAENSPSLDGIAKAYDISWYDENASEGVITTLEQLYGFYIMSGNTNYEGKTVKLGADIAINQGKAGSWSKKAPSNSWYPISGFAGTFDGQGHTISGMYINATERYLGFFGKTEPGSTVKNLRLKNSLVVNMWGDTRALSTGSIAGVAHGTFENIYSNATMETAGYYMGGLFGQVFKETTISNCWYDGKITHTGRYAGGIVGFVSGSTVNVEHCLNTGTMDIIWDSGYCNSGGIVGATMTNDDIILNITDCLNSGTLTAEKGGLGSILGHCVTGTVNIKDTYATTESNTKDGLAVGWVQGTVNGSAVQFPRTMMIGVGGYQYTSLDFNKYWAAVANTTPQLKSIAGRGLSLAGVEKLYDTSWYKANKSVYTLTDAKDLYGLTILSLSTDFSGKTIRLGATIVMNDGDADTFEMTPPKQAWMPISKFAGTFDGQGHSIKGIYVPSGNKVGLFSETTETAVIKNLKLEESYICGATSTGTGSIVGRGGGTFSAIYSDAIVKSEMNSVGGIIGYINLNTTMDQIQFNGSVTGRNQVGGLAANVKGANVTLTNCLVTGTVATVATKGHMNAGMFVGMIDANSDVAAIQSLAIGYLRPSIVSSGNYARVFVGKVTGNDALFHCERVYCVSDTDHIDDANKGLIGILNPKKDGQPTYTNCGWKGTAGSGIKRLSIAQMTGANAMYNISAFEFCTNAADTSKAWVTVIDDTPMLRIFANSSQIVDLTEYVVADTSWYKDGVGSSEDNPYIIADEGDLLGLSELVNAGKPFKNCYFKVVNDIEYNTKAPATLAEWEQYTPKNLFTPIGTEANNKRFAGTFDGDGHTIKGIYVSMTSDQRFVGLFGATESTAVIKNLKLENSYFEGNAQVGSISGRGGGTFENIESNAVVVGTASTKYTGNCIGGFLGMANATTVTMKDCKFTGEVYSEGDYAAGLLGVIQGSSKATITDCFVSGSMTSGAGHGAGIVGAITGKSAVAVEDCDVSATVKGNKYTGGICGKVGYYLKNGSKVTENKGSLTVKDSSFTGTIIASDTYAGGIVGYVEQASAKDENYAVTLEGCTFNGTVSSTKASVGGLIGEASKNAIVTITECVSSGTVTSSVSGAGKVGGIIGAGGTTATITIARTSFTGSARHTTSGKYITQVGGILGLAWQSNVTLEECMMSGNVEATQQAGGLIGSAQSAGTDCNVTMTDCHITGSVTSTAGDASEHMSGGLIGYINNSKTDGSCTVNTKAERCVLTGTLNFKEASYGCVLVGQIKGYTDLTCSKGVYYITDHEQWKVQKDDNSYLLYQVKGTQYGTIDTSAVKGLTATQLTGVTAVSNVAGLKTSSNTWVAIREGFPALRFFVTDEAQIVAPLQTIAADTTWYTEAADGVGTKADNPYVIADEGDLLGLANLVNGGNAFEDKYFELQGDILYNADAPATKAEWDAYLAEHANDNAIAEFVPIGNKENPFKGNFDGNNCKFVGIYISATSSAEGTGLFGATDGANIQNLKLENCYMKANGNVGSVAGYGSGTFSNIETNTVVISTGTYAGGIIGYASGTVKINDSISETIISGTNCVGGMIGEVKGAVQTEIIGCQSEAILSAADKAGGFIGSCGTGADMIVEKSAFTGKLNADEHVGGIIGLIYQGEISITECATNAEITALVVGGLIGSSQAKNASCTITISDCHIGGTIIASVDTGMKLAGLIGDMDDQNNGATYKISADVDRCLLTAKLLNCTNGYWPSILVARAKNYAALTLSDVYYINDADYLELPDKTRLYLASSLDVAIDTSDVKPLSKNHLTGKSAEANIAELMSQKDESGNNIWVTTDSFPTLRIFAN